MFKDIFALTLVSSLRFFGLFIALPAIGIYTKSFEASAFLAGIAAGGYAITQIIFQTPFGILSDKYDKKKIIIIGLLIFIAGSLVCAFSDSITMLIIGRFLQGAGAIGSVISAQIAELTREEQRPKAMAIMGAGIFIGFILAMILGPLIAGYLGLNAIFFLTAILNIIALGILVLKVPSTPSIEYSFTNAPFSDIVKSRNLQVMNLSSFLQKFLMISTFILVALTLDSKFAYNEQDLWEIYAPAAILGLLALGPSSALAQKKGYFKQVMLFGIVCFTLSYLLLGIGVYYNALWVFVIGVFVFFVGFSVHEPIMQTLTSRYPKAHQKGSALGFFTTMGFVGSAIGAISAGEAYQHFGLFALSIATAFVCVAWGIVMIYFLENPINEKNLYLEIARYPQEHYKRLDSLNGIIEWYSNLTQGIVIVKFDNTQISEEKIIQTLKQGV